MIDIENNRVLVTLMGGEFARILKKEEWKRTLGKFTFQLLPLWSALAYFIYGGLEGTMAILILCILYGAASLLALIPFGGVVAQAIVMKLVIWPWVVAFTGITVTWLTGLIFWIDVVIGIILTIVMTISVLAMLAKR